MGCRAKAQRGGAGFKARGSDWVADLRNSPQRAQRGEVSGIRLQVTGVGLGCGSEEHHHRGTEDAEVGGFFIHRWPQMATDGLGCGCESDDFTTEGTEITEVGGEDILSADVADGRRWKSPQGHGEVSVCRLRSGSAVSESGEKGSNRGLRQVRAPEAKSRKMPVLFRVGSVIPMRSSECGMRSGEFFIDRWPQMDWVVGRI
jgi:hypothetical protein